MWYIYIYIYDEYCCIYGSCLLRYNPIYSSTKGKKEIGKYKIILNRRQILYRIKWLKKHLKEKIIVSYLPIRWLTQLKIYIYIYILLKEKKNFIFLFSFFCLFFFCIEKRSVKWGKKQITKKKRAFFPMNIFK